jgi:hypothetical protein
VLALSEGSPLLMGERWQLWLGNVVVALVVATLWRTLIGRGPLEWLAADLDRAVRRLVGGRDVRAVDQRSLGSDTAA